MNQEDPNTQYELALQYLEDCDENNAIKYLTIAAVQGHMKAQFSLGERYYNGEGVIRDYKKAFKYLTFAANQGHAYAHFIISTCYLCGEGVIKDLKKAVEYLTIAANKGIVDAQSYLGICYHTHLLICYKVL